MYKTFSPVTLREMFREDLNACLIAWGHRMGPVRRPTKGWSHALYHGDDPVAVVATDVLVRERVAGFTRREAIELSRLCASRPDLSRVVLRLWRSFVFPSLAAKRGVGWAISYQDAAAHRGDLYRFDGWVRVGHSRSGTDTRSGRPGRRKVIWGWSEDVAERRHHAVAPTKSVVGAVSSPAPTEPGLTTGLIVIERLCG